MKDRNWIEMRPGERLIDVSIYNDIVCGPIAEGATLKGAGVVELYGDDGRHAAYSYDTAEEMQAVYETIKKSLLQ